MNPYLKKYNNGGKTKEKNPPVEPPMTYSWGTGSYVPPTAQVTNTLGSGNKQTLPSKVGFKGEYDNIMPGDALLRSADKAVGRYLVQPSIELFNAPFATLAEGVNALQGKEASLERALPNPERIALTSEGIKSDIPNQQFLSDFVGVDREKNPYLALGLDILTPSPAMITKPIKALTGLDKATKGTIQYASKPTMAQRAIDNPMSFIKEEVNPYVTGVNPNAGMRFAEQTIDASNTLQQTQKTNSLLRPQLGDVVQPQLTTGVTQAIAKEYTPWTMQEMPGLHIKSTMSGSPFEKQLSKTGELNVSNIQAHINKADVSQQDKFILQKVLNEKFAGKQKVDYNEFRKAISEELVPLQRNILDNDEYGNYGIGRLSYPGIKPESYKSAIENIIDEAGYYNAVKDLKKENLRKVLDNGVEKYVITNRFGRTEYIPTDKIDNWFNGITRESDDFFRNTYPKKAEYEKLLSEIPETKTLTYQNVEKFGKGDPKHYSEPTLAHTRTLISKEEPDVIHFLEQQSDYWQSGAGKNPVKIDYEKWNPRIDKMEKSLADDYAHLEYMKKNRKSMSGDEMNDFQINQFEEILKAREKDIKFNRGNMANPEQKEFLGKAHQERLLQENVQYAVEQGKQKARYPTRETAAKIQSYSPVKKALSADEIKELESKKRGLEYAISEHYATYGNDPNFQFPYLKKMEEELADISKYKYQPGKDIYSDTHETILKKYQDTPKMIEKTLGVKVNIVTDSRGNTWYEFDIPDAYKQGKAEIKAFNIGGIIGTGAAGASMMQQPKEKFRTGGAVNPYLKKYKNGGKTENPPYDPTTSYVKPKKVTIDGKEMSTYSNEYRDLYNTGNIMPVDYEGLPSVYGPQVNVTAEAPEWLKEKRRIEAQGTVADAVRKGTGDFATGLAQGAGAFALGAGEIMNTPLAALGEVVSGRNDFKSVLPNMERALSNVGVGEYKGNQQMTPGNALFPNNPIAAMVLDIPADILLTRGANTLFKQGLKQAPKMFSSASKNLPSFNFNRGNYQNILDKGLDVHDVRLKYHNNQILDLDELDMLNKYGKGTEKNYKNVDPTNLSDAFLDIYGKISETKSDKVDFMKMFLGEDFDKINIPENIQNNIDAPKDIINLEQNIVKPKSPTWNIEDFVMGRYKGPYERTAESKLADKWLTEWYDNPTSKQRFLDYGGTEEGWTEVLNSLENPIRSGKPYPKSLDDIAGLYSTKQNKASINTNILQEELIPTGVHEGAHKTRIVDKNHILKRGPSGLKNLYNDITDASKLQPEETYSEIIRMRYMQGWKPETVVTMDMLEKGLKELGGGYMMSAKIKDKNKLLEIINKAPVVIPGILGTVTAATIGASQLNQQTPQNRYGGQNPYMPTKYKYGGPVDPVDPEDKDAAMRGMMKARMAIDSTLGRNPAAMRMTSVSPKEYTFTGNEMFYDEKQNIPAGATGTHYTTGEGNVMFPIIQEGQDGNLFFNRYASPTDKEAMRFETPEEASYFGENYKSIAPMMYNERPTQEDRKKLYQDINNIMSGKKENTGITMTKLNPDEEFTYQQWAKGLTPNLQGSMDDKNYDMRGAWKSEEQPELFYNDEQGNFQSAHPIDVNQQRSIYEPHLFSRNPFTGKSLKGPNHPSFMHAIEGDIKAGGKIKMDLKTGDMYTYEKGGNAESTVEIERSERVYTPNGKLIMETPADAPTHEEGGVKVTLPAGSLVFPKKYYKALDAASGLPAFKKITKTMLDNAEKAYLRGEPYSSGGKRQ